MNFYDLQQRYRNHLGYPDGDALDDHQLQEIRDNINAAQDHIYMAAPYFHWLVREATITPVSSQTVYTLDDSAEKALEFWTEDSNAHKVMLLSAREVDRNGLRNSNLTDTGNGPYEMTWYPRTTDATASGTSASVTVGSTTLTKSGGSDWTSALAGKLIRLNGESADYYVSSVGGTSTLTMDRAYRDRIVGTGTSGTQSNLSAKRWEISPPGRLRVELFTTSTGGPTISYRYMRRHRVLIADDETPEMPEKYHWLVLYFALLKDSIFREKKDMYQVFKREAEDGLAVMLNEERDQHDMEFQARYESPIRLERQRLPVPHGTYSRRGNIIY